MGKWHFIPSAVWALVRWQNWALQPILIPHKGPPNSLQFMMG